jgi:hypothetical protein
MFLPAWAFASVQFKQTAFPAAQVNPEIGRELPRAMARRFTKRRGAEIRL